MVASRLTCFVVMYYYFLGIKTTRISMPTCGLYYKHILMTVSDDRK